MFQIHLGHVARQDHGNHSFSAAAQTDLRPFGLGRESLDRGNPICDLVELLVQIIAFLEVQDDAPLARSR